MKIRKAVIPAAGLGTRVLPASKAIPKEMLPIVDKPVIQYIVEEAVQAGITDILVITSRGKGAIADHFDRSPELEERLLAGGKQAVYDQIRAIPELANLTFIRQKETKGLGHAVLCAREFVGDGAGIPVFGNPERNDSDFHEEDREYDGRPVFLHGDGIGREYGLLCGGIRHQRTGDGLQRCGDVPHGGRFERNGTNKCDLCVGGRERRERWFVLGQGEENHRGCHPKRNKREAGVGVNGFL